MGQVILISIENILEEIDNCLQDIFATFAA